MGLKLLRTSSDNAAPNGSRNNVENGNYEDCVYIHYISECDLVDVSIIQATFNVVLLEKMESMVYIFSDGTHEQFFITS